MGEFTLRLEAPYTQNRGQTTVLDVLPGVRESWERTENRWGFFQGVFSIRSDAGLNQLIDWHGLWLGHEVVERVGVYEVFRGYVHELRLYHNDICRVFGYDVGGEGSRVADPGMYNAVQAAIDNLVENGEFEEPGTGGQLFAEWSQSVAGGDGIGTETTEPIKGGVSPYLQNGGNGNTYLRQSIPVLPKTGYRISFVSCGDGSVAGRYRVRDGSSANDIIPISSTENTGLGQFRGVTEEIVTPAGCTEIALYFYAPATNGRAVFDSVSVKRILDGSPAQDYTDWAVQEQSIARHGRREIVLEPRGLAPKEAARMRDSLLQARAWPQERQQNGDGSTRLEVFVLGHIHRAGWLYVGDLAGKRDTCSAHVSAMAEKLPWVQGTAVRPNEAAYTIAEQPQRILDALRDVVEAGDGDGRQWRCFIDVGRRLVYEPVNFAPELSMSAGIIYRRLGNRQAQNPRLIRAMQVVRNYDFPDRSSLPGTQLQQRNDSLLESVTVGADGLRRQWVGG